MPAPVKAEDDCCNVGIFGFFTNLFAGEKPPEPKRKSSIFGKK